MLHRETTAERHLRPLGSQRGSLMGQQEIRKTLRFHYSGVIWALGRLISQATRLFVKRRNRANNVIKTAKYWPIELGIHRWSNLLPAPGANSVKRVLISEYHFPMPCHTSYIRWLYGPILLTDRGRMTYKCVGQLCRHWIRQWLVTKPISGPMMACCQLYS